MQERLQLRSGAEANKQAPIHDSCPPRRATDRRTAVSLFILAAKT